MHKIAELDHAYLWHPFTQMRDWLKTEPVVIASGQGAVLRDVYGREYLDANSSIWTNLHGHCHPELNEAITAQLRKISHSSALGFANEPASLLGAELIRVANPPPNVAAPAGLPPANPRLTKVFFSDDGSTAMEVALKLAYEYARRSGLSPRPRFLALDGAYHGDTVGAVSLGHIDLFHRAYSGLLFKSDKVAAPYCYRCPHNKATPERRDAREYRVCGQECLAKLSEKVEKQTKKGAPYAGFVFEPLMQGAGGLIAQPKGWLAQAAQIVRPHGTVLIADEVMTGFGRTGVGTGNQLFACEKEGVIPDFQSVAKGLTGGYLPMAATFTTQAVFDAFLGEYEEFKSFFHGHSFTANQLGAAAGLASLRILERSESIDNRRVLEQTMREELGGLWTHSNVGDIRQVGLVAGIELVRDWRTREPFGLTERAGIRICEAMARRGVLTRPVGNAIVLMPPYCTTPEQARTMVGTLRGALDEVWPGA